ncbi:MAG: FG-GAP repeat protein [Burkholderiales bacterium]|nr:FG-GAP repeat protein [Burkholderiales bacterium]
MLSIAGAWAPNGATDAGGVPIGYVGPFYSAIVLPDGRNGLVLSAWSIGHDGNFYPVSTAIFAQADDGTMVEATAQYLADPWTNGSSSVVVADFNGDGHDDIFLAAFSEAPVLFKSSTAYLSNAAGTFDKVDLGDEVWAHHATLATFEGKPTVFLTGFDGDPHPYYQFVDGAFVQTQLVDEAKGQTSNGYPVPPAAGDTAAFADFDGDGDLDIVMGDVLAGPGMDDGPYLTVVFDLADLIAATGAPLAELQPYFDGKPAYASISSYIGPGLSHTYRVWADDFNHDGRPDILAGVSLFPQPYSVLQMFQNTGGAQFDDVTAALNPDYDITSAEVDYSMQMVDIDASGIDSYFLAGQLAAPQDKHSNYILLNDGSGRLHVYIHDEFAAITEAIMAQTGGGPAPFRFIEYLAGGRINLLAEVSLWSERDGHTINLVTYWNVPLQLDPSVDFTQDVTVADRNGSRLLRTWAGNDRFEDAGLADAATGIDGGAGIDTAAYSGARAAYQLSAQEGGTWLVQGAAVEGDTLVRVERLEFADGHVAIDVAGHAGTVAKVLGAMFGPQYVAHGQFAGIGLSLLDDGVTYQDLVGLAIGTGVFEQLAGSRSHTDFVRHVYENVVGSLPAPGELEYFVALLESGTFTQASLGLLACETALNAAQVGLAGLAQTGLAYEPWV